MIKIELKSKSVIKIPLPDYVQENEYSCAAAALRSLFNYYFIDSFDEKLIRKGLNLTSNGTDPYQIIKFLKKYKKYNLNFKEFRKMKLKELIKCIENKKPVLMMLQAWTENKKLPYKNAKKDGHWVVAIGYDRENIYFEDPSLNNVRGYIDKVELEDRWHDIENYSSKDKKVHLTDHYGIAVWGKNVNNNIIRTRKIK